MAGLQVYDLGNVLLNAERIKDMRAARDPGSLDNRIKQQQLNALLSQSQGPAIEYGRVNPGDFTPQSLAAYEEAGGGPANFGLLQPYNAPQVTNIAGVPYLVNRSGGGNIELSSLEDELAAQRAASAAKARGTLETELELEPQIAAEKIRSEAEATAALPENIEKQQIAEDEARMVIQDIDFLLSPREGGGAFMNYAYGRKSLAPDFVKPAEWVDAEAMRDRIIANLQLQQVGKLKGTGPITENEQLILKQAASILGNPLISHEIAQREMRRVRDIFKRSADRAAKKQGKEGVTGWDDL